jgi:hypothetical protein
MGMIVVYLNDTGVAYEQAEEFFAEASAWASRQCASYVDYHVQDVSDHSYTNDFITEYRFNDPKDAMLFQLRWKNS